MNEAIKKTIFFTAWALGLLVGCVLLTLLKVALFGPEMPMMAPVLGLIWGMVALFLGMLAWDRWID